MAGEGGKVSEGLLWLSLSVALSPVLVDLAAYLTVTPWAQYVLIFPLVTVRALVRCHRSVTPKRDGIALLFLAIGIELLAVRSGVPRAGQIAIPLAALGLARSLGRPLLAVAALTLWWIPVPLTLASQVLVSDLLAAATALWQGLGLHLVIEGSRVVGPGGSLAVQPADAGIPLAALLSGLGYYAATLRGRTLGIRMRTAGAWAVFALPVQSLAVFLAIGTTGLAGADFARHGLSYAPWLGAATVGWIVAERGARFRPGEGNS